MKRLPRSVEKHARATLSDPDALCGIGEKKSTFRFDKLKASSREHPPSGSEPHGAPVPSPQVNLNGRQQGQSRPDTATGAFNSTVGLTNYVALSHLHSTFRQNWHNALLKWETCQRYAITALTVRANRSDVPPLKHVSFQARKHQLCICGEPCHKNMGKRVSLFSEGAFLLLKQSSIDKTVRGLFKYLALRHCLEKAGLDASIYCMLRQQSHGYLFRKPLIM
jgi:hypothetical protein